MNKSNKIENMALFMRRKILDISYQSSSAAHLGGGLSMVEVMATLYSHILKFDKNNPRWEERDRFILSKGHGVLGYFSALLASGLISEDKYATYLTNESDLIAHPIMNLDLGIESSNGSLGQGLAMGIGIAYSAKKNKNLNYRAFVYLGDGECNEGSVWEAVMLAPQLKLDNLIAVVDYNKLQSDMTPSRDIINFEDLAAKFEAFGWDVYDVDGHNIAQLIEAFEAKHDDGKPKMIVANTIKGKGISFMENNNEWHHNVLTKSKYEIALAELER
jgi:transketolase